MADKTISQRIAFEGGKEMEAQLKSLGDAGEKAFQKFKKAADDAVGFGPNLSAAITAVQVRARFVGEAFTNAKEKLSEFGTKSAEVAEKLAITTAAVGAVGFAFFKLVDGAAEAADKVAKTSEALGITTQQFQALNFVASQAGLSTDQLTKGLIKLVQSSNETEKANIALGDQYKKLDRDVSRNNLSSDEYVKRLQEIQDNAKTATDPLSRLGISVRGLDGNLKNAHDLLLEVADAFKATDDEALKSQILFDAFGSRTGTRFANALNEGKEGIEALIKEQERLAPAFTKAEVAIGVKFSDALDRTRLALESLKNSFGLKIAEPFIATFDALNEVIARNRAAILSFAREIANRLKPILADVISLLEGKKIDPQGFVGRARDAFVSFGNAASQAIQIIVGAWERFVAVLNVVANIINKIFGTNISGQALAIVAVLGVVSGAFAAIAAAVGAVVAALGVLDAVLVVLFGPEAALLVGLALMGAALGALIAQIPLVQTAFQAVVDGFNGTVANFATLFNLIGAAWKLLWIEAANFFKGIVDNITAVFQAVIDKINVAIDAVKKFFNTANNASGNSAQGFAQGGKVSGPGSSRSDSILARLSNGEFVQQAPAVAHYGERFMHALNNMQIPRSVVDGLTGFARGGFVHSMAAMMPVPGFATGGLVTAGDLVSASGGGRPVVLNIGGETFTGLHAEDNTAERLTRFATRKSIEATGRKPTWDR